MNINKETNRKRSKTLIPAVLILLLLLAAGGAFYLYRAIFLSPAFNAGKGEAKWLYVRPGETWSTVLGSAAGGEESALGSRLPRVILDRFPDRFLKSRTPKAGAYLILPDASLYALFNAVSRGRQTPVKLTFTSRRLPREMWGQMARSLMADSLSIARAMTDRTLLAELGVPDTTMAYRLLPNTYEVYWTITPEELVKRMEREYRAFWTAERTSRADRLGLTPYEVSILASIVEEESAKTDEYPRIAGLYLNRLRKGIPLQADPTVKFALGDFGLRRILLKHLSVPSPYNTYLVKGLPPGPIRIPSVSALDGVLGAEEHDYLFMVAKADFSGYHDFSRTLAEHTRKARLYQKELDRRKIKK